MKRSTILGAIVLLTAWHVQAQFKETLPYKEVRINGSRPWGNPNVYSAAAGRGFWDKKNVAWADDVKIWPHYISRLGKVNYGADFKIRFPDLRKGDIVCALNGLYTVDEVSPDEDSPSVLFKRLSADNVPRGVTFRPNTIVVPLSTTGKYGQLQMYERGLGLRAIEREKDKKGEPGRWVAHTIEFMPIYEGLAEHKAQLREGDILLFAGRGHRVLGIVPKDEKTRVIGWMELEAVPVGTEEEMKKNKIAFVRPTPPKELPKLDPKRDR